MTDKVSVPFEPTEAMIQAVSGILSPYAARRVWEKMVEVALFSDGSGAGQIEGTDDQVRAG